MVAVGRAFASIRCAKGEGVHVNSRSLARGDE